MKLRAIAIVVGLSTSSVFAGGLGDATQTICADGTDALCSTLPTDMAGVPPRVGYIPDTDAGTSPNAFSQTYVDYFGWQAFVALNWPVGANGQPSSTQTIVSDVTSPRVWSTYPTKDDVFGLQLSGLDLSMCTVKPGNIRLLRISKFGLSSFSEAFTPWPLIDRQGNFVLYDVRLNRTEANYLRSNDLTTKAGQATFHGTYNFPPGNGANIGSIEIKSSWRVMTDKDDPTQYYTTGATIIVPPQSSENGQQLCIETTVGLVGMHIIQKFANPAAFSTFWSWSTFEHVQNAPLADNAPISPSNDASPIQTTLLPPSCNKLPDPNDTTPYSFYDSRCKNGRMDCPINTPPGAWLNKFKWSASQPYAGSYMTQGTNGAFGTQVARCFAIYPSAQTATGAYWAKFGNSVWSNYMLVGAQWAASNSTTVGPLDTLSPFAAPSYLANTTSETYLQTGILTDPQNNAAGSCVMCHSVATDTTGKPSNFSFLPGDAQ